MKNTKDIKNKTKDVVKQLKEHKSVATTAGKNVHRITLTDAICHPKDTVGAKEPVMVTTFYNKNGLVDPKLTTDTATAVSSSFKNNNTFKVKILKTGEFFNPLKIDRWYDIGKQDKTTNEPLFKMKTVSEKSFKNYIKFLQEKHDSLLILAQREA